MMGAHHWSELRDPRVPGETVFDTIVIGGGPTGASAAAVLARAGCSVLVIEKDEYPRFHIGESLVPGVLPYLEETGAADAVRSAGFIKKYGAEFVTPDLSFRQRYVFGDSLTPEADLAYQVERADFDQILLEAAERAGACVSSCSRVIDFDVQQEHVGVTIKDRQGGKRQLVARYLIDASGQQSLIAGRLGLRKMDSALRNVAVFAHFAGVRRGEDEAAGDITVVLDPEGWWWVIPLRNGVTSLGYVAPSVAFNGKPDVGWFERRLAETPVLCDLFHEATRIGDVRTASDYSYRSTELTDGRWLLAGDAAAFLDPVFSTGVFLGVSSGVRAAQAVHSALCGSVPARQAFKDYALWQHERLKIYGELVKGFYCPEFTDLFMHPTDSMQLKQGVTSALAGYADHAGVRWRLRSFLSAVRANKHLELSPRLPGRREAAARLSQAAAMRDKRSRS